MKYFIATNITNQNVSLADLALTIPAHRSFNLLDSKHFSYSLEQLQASMETGSLFKKSDKIKLSFEEPKKIINTTKIEIATEPFCRPPKYKYVEIEEKHFDEFPTDQIVSDQKFADEFSDEGELLWNPKK